MAHKTNSIGSENKVRTVINNLNCTQTARFIIVLFPLRGKKTWCWDVCLGCWMSLSNTPTPQLGNRYTEILHILKESGCRLPTVMFISQWHNNSTMHPWVLWGWQWNGCLVTFYEGSYAWKSYFKFCFEDPVYFVHLMEQNLGNQNRNWINRTEFRTEWKLDNFGSSH